MSTNPQSRANETNKIQGKEHFGLQGRGRFFCAKNCIDSSRSDILIIRVEACGICHTDAYTINGTYPGLTLPRVPGHEVIGRIEALGQGVSCWKIGQRVGVGLIAGEDGVCEPCRRGDMVNCEHPVLSGVTADGGHIWSPYSRCERLVC